MARGIVCPFCHSENVDNTAGGPLYWISLYDVASEYEDYRCKRCGNEFVVKAVYQMSGYIAYDDDGNEIEEAEIIR